MLTKKVSASALLSAIPFPTASPPTVLSSVSRCVSYNLCVGKGTLCQQVVVSPKLDRGVVRLKNTNTDRAAWSQLSAAPCAILLFIDYIG